jgi:hypothetical protein
VKTINRICAESHLDVVSIGANYLIQSLDPVLENPFEHVNWNLAQKLANCPFEIVHLSKFVSSQLVLNVYEEEEIT